MGNTRRKPADAKPARRSRPATTPEGRENQMIALAVDVTERQMREGTASAQQITHYLKLGSSREKLEQQRLRRENELLQARVEQLNKNQHSDEIYSEALNAFRGYAGQDPGDQYEDEYDDEPY